MNLEDIGLCPVSNMRTDKWSPPAKSYSLPVEDCVISHLPFPITDSGEFKSIYDMTMRELIWFISTVLDYEIKRNAIPRSQGKDSPPIAPDWWPSNIPYPLFFVVLRYKPPAEAYEALVQLLVRCYEAADCALVLQFADYMCNAGKEHYAKVVHNDKFVSVHEVAGSGRLVATVSSKNVMRRPKFPELDAKLNAFPRDLLSWTRSKRASRPSHNFVSPARNPAVLDLSIDDPSFFDDPDYTEVDFSSPLGLHVFRHHSVFNSSVHQFQSFLETERYCSTVPSVVRESVNASNRMPHPHAKPLTHSSTTRYGSRLRRRYKEEPRDYCFTKAERRERKLVLDSGGLDAPSRALLDSCLDFDLSLGRDICARFLRAKKAEAVRARARSRSKAAAAAAAATAKVPRPGPRAVSVPVRKSARLSPGKSGNVAGPSSGGASSPKRAADSSSAAEEGAASTVSQPPTSSLSSSPTSSSSSSSTAFPGPGGVVEPSCGGPNATPDDDASLDSELLSRPDAPGPATMKRLAAIRAGMSVEDALRRFPKVFVERQVLTSSSTSTSVTATAAEGGRRADSESSSLKKSRTLSVLLMDECKYLRNLGLGELLSTEKRLTRHSELKPEADSGSGSGPGSLAARRNKRKARASVADGKSDRPGGGGSRSQSVKSRTSRRASLPLPHLPLPAPRALSELPLTDENKPLSDPKRKRVVDPAAVVADVKLQNGGALAEKRVLREKEPKVNGVAANTELKVENGRTDRIPRVIAAEETKTKTAVPARNRTVARGLNLPAASNTRFKTGSSSTHMKFTPAQAHRRFISDYGVLCVISVRRYAEAQPHLGCCGVGDD